MGRNALAQKGPSVQYGWDARCMEGTGAKVGCSQIQQGTWSITTGSGQQEGPNFSHNQPKEELDFTSNVLELTVNI